ncbi:MAG: MBL fold metallo-hydrolase [Lentisphaerae bacterium]|nr:MBL fold metallo-hydrolase [Lentisphaerota bacterium]
MSEFQIQQLGPGGFDGNFTYLVTAPDKTAFLVDPCIDPEVIRKAIKVHDGIKPVYILITHAHGDHFSALEEILPSFPAKVCTSEKSSLNSDITVHDGTVLPFYGGGITAIETPGHTDDSICWKLPDDSAIFTGDTLFVDYIGFCNAYKMFHSLERLRQLPDDMVICSGHHYGHVPIDTIGHQKKVNPFFAPESFSGFKQALLDLK